MRTRGRDADDPARGPAGGSVAMAPAAPPAEVRFAQRLASHERPVRERAVRKLRQYLSLRTRREAGGFSADELLKLWRGLFHCLALQDQPPLQEELAAAIARLVHDVGSPEAQRLFVQTFWQTLNREWTGADTPRLDRLRTLTRLVLRQSFEVLRREGWEQSRVELLLDVLVKEVLLPESRAPAGVKLHLVGSYLRELARVAGGELLAHQSLAFIDPFCKVAARTKDPSLVQTIASGVFEAIVEQSSLVSAQAANGGLPGAEPQAPCRTPAPGRRGHTEDGGGDGEAESLQPLQFDYKAVADRLLAMTSRKSTPAFNRKRLSRLVRKFQELSGAGGVAAVGFSEGLTTAGLGQTNAPQEGSPSEGACAGEMGAESGQGHDPCAAEASRGAQKRKRKKRSRLSAQQTGAESQQGAGDTADTTPAPTAPSETPRVGEPSVAPAPGKRKRLRKRGLRVQEDAPEPAAAPPKNPPRGNPGSAATPGFLACGTHSPKKQRLEAPPVNGRGPAALTWPPPLKEGPRGRVSEGEKGRGLKRKKGEPGAAPHSLLGQKTGLLKKRKKVKASNLVQPSGASVSPVELLQSPATACSPVRKKPRMESDFVRVHTPIPPKALFFRKASKARSSSASPSPSPGRQLNRTPGSSKKVTFGLSRNMTTEFKKTDKSLLVSPTGPSRVAFNPEQRPLHGVLKTPSSPLVSPPLPPAPRRRPTAMDFF